MRASSQWKRDYALNQRLATYQKGVCARAYSRMVVTTIDPEDRGTIFSIGKPTQTQSPSLGPGPSRL